MLNSHRANRVPPRPPQTLGPEAVSTAQNLNKVTDVTEPEGTSLRISQCCSPCFGGFPS